MTTLDQLLASRDARAQHQRELLGMHPGGSLVCLTVLLPGAEKRTPASLRIGAAGVEALRSAFGSEPQVRDLQTGYEAYLPVALPAAEAKLRCCEIEDSHPLGRLMDIDVIAPGGVPLSRTEVGLQERRCLICDKPARWCMRERSHSVQELLAVIENMVEAYGEL